MNKFKYALTLIPVALIYLICYFAQFYTEEWWNLPTIFVLAIAFIVSVIIIINYLLD